jgi:hypothetical protein
MDPKYCHTCNKKFGVFTWRHPCEKCDDTFCSDCITRFRSYRALYKKPKFDYISDFLCKTCYGEVAGGTDYNYGQALSNYHNIDTFPATYQGNTNATIENEPLASRKYRRKTIALSELQVNASYLGYGIIYNIEYNRYKNKTDGTSRDGTYIYNTWSATGIATKKEAPSSSPDDKPPIIDRSGMNDRLYRTREEKYTSGRYLISRIAAQCDVDKQEVFDILDNENVDYEDETSEVTIQIYNQILRKLDPVSTLREKDIVPVFSVPNFVLKFFDDFKGDWIEKREKLIFNDHDKRNISDLLNIFSLVKGSGTRR